MGIAQETNFPRYLELLTDFQLPSVMKAERRLFPEALSLTFYLSMPYIGRTSRRRHADREIRPPSRHSRHAHSEDRGPRPRPRLRHLASHPPNLQGSSSSPARLALPCAPSPRKARLARSGLGRIRKRPTSQVLPPVSKGTQAVGKRRIELESPG